MKKLSTITLMILTIMSLTSCEIIGGIFKAGVWSGILIVVVVVALLIWLLAKMFGGRRD
ncbi:hypothetical protein [Sphingobacterium faecale]|uniref:Phosphatidate cytidylyltransferase n=1 Tax=Sphingobacterium faecale TaxID=2803775 RepID=A0ABS1R4U3_9SPHI|nr:hypothetical protein [Sphingobacterium faecale]MBL1409741.1 hypothetical protein [Sphingobacterium faecale]